MVRWILFDLGNVIVHHVFEGKKNYLINGKSLPAEKVESIYSLDSYNSYASGKLPESEFVDKFLKLSNLSISRDEFLQLYKADIKCISGMKDVLDRLFKQYALALLTNEGREWGSYKIDLMNLRKYFKKIIVSANLGVLKPNNEFFLKSLELLDAKSEECVFIDDQEKNCRAAESLGIKTILFLFLLPFWDKILGSTAEIIDDGAPYFGLTKPVFL